MIEAAIGIGALILLWQIAKRVRETTTAVSSLGGRLDEVIRRGAGNRPTGHI